MSFQFEDESALEELLNQQLEKRRQPQQFAPLSSTPIAASKPTNITARPSTGVPTSAGTNEPQKTAGNTGSSFVRPSIGSARLDKLGNERGKLSSWLDRAPNESEALKVSQSDMKADAPAINSYSVRKRATLKEETPAIKELVDEDALQSMSKQRLIQFIQQELVPNFENLRKSANNDSNLEREVAELEQELASTRTQLNIIELRHSEQEKLIESKWIQINDQLRSRLETNEKELTSTIERQQQHLEQITKDHQEQMMKLQENYQLKLAEERRLNAEIIKRRDEFHKLELESKLKVNFDLVNLETVFSEWHNMMHSTIEDLNCQFKSVESLLDKQAIKVANTNRDLETKSQLVLEQQQKLDSSNNHISQVATKLEDILPKVVQFQQVNEKWATETKAQTKELTDRLTELRNKEDQLYKQGDELRANKETLNEERMQLRIELNKLTLKQEQLEQLEARLKVLQMELEDKTRVLNERELQLESTRISQENKTSELKQLNNELLYTRRKLSLREAQVQQRKIELTNERRTLRVQTSRLEELQSSIRKESNQLKRLQRSLVCSICFDRLFSQNDNDYNNNNNRNMKTKLMRQEPRVTRLSPKELLLLERDHNRDLVGDNINYSNQNNDISNNHDDEDNYNDDDEISKLSRYTELDLARLKRESKYVEFISKQS